MSTWEEISRAYCVSEGDVESRVLLPLLLLIGYKPGEIHSKVPVQFREGTKRGRPHEADLVISESDPKITKKAAVVIEAKAPGKELSDGVSQADSYSHALKAPFYVVSNGTRLQVWQKQPFCESTLVLDTLISELPLSKEKIVLLLNKNSILSYIQKYNIPNLSLSKFTSEEYLSHLDAELAVKFVVPRKLFSGSASLNHVLVDEKTKFTDLLSNFSGIIISAFGGRGKTTLVKKILQSSISSVHPYLPVYIPLNESVFSVIEEIINKINLFSPGSVSKSGFGAWVKSQKLIVGIDNWEDVPSPKKGKIETELGLLVSLGVPIIIGKRPNALS